MLAQTTVLSQPQSAIAESTTTSPALAEAGSSDSDRCLYLQSNEPLDLGDATTLYQIQQGSVALFAIYPQTPELRGCRRYLFTTRSGDLIIPAAVNDAEMAITDATVPAQLLAIAVESTILTPILLQDYVGEFQTAPKACLERLESWIYQLSGSLTKTHEPKLNTSIAQSGLLGTGEIYRPPTGQVVWLSLSWGWVQWLGEASLDWRASPMPLPLSSQLWIEAQATSELNQVVPQPHQIIPSLRQIHQRLFARLHQLEQDERWREQERFQARIQLNQQSVDETLTGFATILKPRSKQRRQSEQVVIAQTLPEAALIAAGAVGRALGVEIHPPLETDSGSDPIEAIARASQIRIRAVSLDRGWQKQDGGPLFAYTRESQLPVALLPCSATAYDLLNPMTGERRRCTQRLAATLEPIAYSFYRPLPEQVTPWALARFILRSNVKEFAVILGIGIAVTLLGMVPPQLTGLLIDQAIPNADGQLLAQMALGLLAITLGTTLFQLSQSIAVMRLETRADSETQAAVWDRLLKLDTSFFRRYDIGDLSSRVSAVTQIRQKLGSTLLKSLFSSIFSFLNLGLLFYYSPTLALVALVVAVINISVTITASLLTLKKMRPLVEEQGKLFGVLVQLINGISKFRVAGAEPRAYAYWGKQYSHQLRLLLGSERIEDNLTVINSLLSALTPAILFWVATTLLQASQAEGGSFSTGTFLAFNAAFGTFIGGATNLSTIAVDIFEVLPVWQRAQPILQTQPEVSADKADPGRLSGQLTVERVVFRYRPEGSLNLDQVSIQAKPGEFIAFVGPSGSGKSTLLRMILGFEQPESGMVAFDGQDAAGLDITAVRRQLGVVLQNSRLMSASIFDNIASSAPISMDEAWDAARMAGFEEDIAQMPMGMHTVVSEGGTNLSGGQRQRLLIARALALRPRILLFDEATSALDNRTQAIVSESLDRLKVTRIVVAHRLSTIRNADRIYVLKAGQVVEVGDFEALALQDGLFSQLIKRQQV